MKLRHGRHLAYCTNIHRGESWEEVWGALKLHTLAVRDRVRPSGPYAIGLRLSARAAGELREPGRLAAFRRWLDAEGCYVFTINGFPYGQFHGTRVKEQVYAPDWTRPERLEYTLGLFEILAELLPEGVEGSVSTVPVSFKGFAPDGRALRQARTNLWSALESLERLSRRTGRRLHLDLEPEPLCTLETTAEAVEFFEAMRADRPGDLRVDEHLGVNYDCCHLAIEFESAAEGLGRLRQHRIRVGKIHLSNALAVRPTADARVSLRDYVEGTYFHQVIERGPNGARRQWRDLSEALADPAPPTPGNDFEWRIHFHIPLHRAPDGAFFATTAAHVRATLDWLAEHPDACGHLEMETYTWEVLPSGLKHRSVVDQLADEYAWTLAELGRRGLA